MEDGTELYLGCPRKESRCLPEAIAGLALAEKSCVLPCLRMTAADVAELVAAEAVSEALSVRDWGLGTPP